MALVDIQNYIVAAIVFCIIITGGVIYIIPIVAHTTIADARDVQAFNKTLNKASEVTLEVNAISTDVSKEYKFGPLGAVEGLLNAAWDGIRGIGKAMSFMSIATVEYGSSIGISPILLALLVLIIITVISFSIWQAVLNRY